MRKILVLEDDPNIGKMLSVMLKAEGYFVELAEDGVSGLSKAVKSPPDLVLTDIRMPAGDGFTIVERMQDLQETMAVPVVFMTASKEDGLAQRAERLGAVAFLEKPFDKDQMLATIRHVMDERQV